MKQLLLVLFTCGILFAGNYDHVEIDAPFFVQSAPIESLHSIGFSNMFTADAANIASGNPAVLSAFIHPSVGIDYEYATRIKLYQDIYIERALQQLPVSAGVVYPFKNFWFGLTYQRKYSNYLDFGEIPITTIENPEGNGETIHAISETNSHSFSGLFSFVWDNFFIPGDRMALGMQISADYLYVDEKIYHAEARVRDQAVSSRIGLQYQINSKFGIGFVFDKAADFNSVIKIKDNTFVQDTSTGLSLYTTREASNAYRMNFPDKAVFGVQFSPTAKLQLSGTLAYVIWERVHPNYRNQLDFSLGSIVVLPNLFELSIGLLSTDRQSQSGGSLWGNEAMFMNLGIRKQIGGALLRVEIYDSHWLSDKARQQIIAKAGVNWIFY